MLSSNPHADLGRMLRLNIQRSHIYSVKGIALVDRENYVHSSRYIYHDIENVSVKMDDTNADPLFLR